jgi:hypothetical protein
MKIKKIDTSEITSEHISKYKEEISKLEGFLFTGLDTSLEKRIITLRLGNQDEELTLVNPTIVNADKDKSLVYFEKDSVKKSKVRKTIRYPHIIINTDNLGKVEFKASNENRDWKNADEFFGDVGLLECVLVQRAIDAINGIDITHPMRAYSETITKDKEPGRNERVMLQGPNGEMEFVKSKKVDAYLQKGWNLI